MFEDFTTTKNQDEITGTGLKGYIDIRADQLTEIFGEPQRFEGGKVQAQWIVKTEGVVISIYDYKEYDRPLENVTRFHIGGFEAIAVHGLKAILENNGAEFGKVISRYYNSRDRRLVTEEL